MKVFIRFFIICLLLLTSSVCFAEELDAKFITKILDSIDLELKRKAPRLEKLEKLDKFYSEPRKYRSWAQACVAKIEKELVDVNHQIEVLGEVVKGETREVVKARKNLTKQQDKIKKELAVCKVILLRSEDLSKKIGLVKQAVLAQKLLARGPRFFHLIRDNWDNPSIWTDALKTFVLKHRGLVDHSVSDFILLFTAILIVLLLSFVLRKKLYCWQQQHQPTQTLSSQLACALATTSERYIAYLFSIYTATITLTFINLGIIPTPFVVIAFNGLSLVVTLNALIHFYLNSSLLIHQYEPLEKKNAVQLAHRLKILVIIIVFGYLIFATILTHSLSEPVSLISRGIFGAILVLNLLWVVWLMGYFHKFGKKLSVRFVLTLLFIAALIAEWSGYRNLSLFLIDGIVATIVLLGVFSVISRLISEFLESLDKGKSKLALMIRNWLGVKSDKNFPGLMWIRLISSLVVWSIFITLILLVWQVPYAYTRLIYLYIVEGFLIGSYTLVPVQLVKGIFVLSVGLLINSWFKRKLEKNLLPKTNLARSARESMSTIIGYVGATIAIIIALGVIGVDFSKLVLIAGALSVGIGFGLQNIVNNFISGLILLFERPIKTGDWIVVGQTEGTVKKVSIRSTLIQTFDRSDVVVPNSELVSGTVINWMLRDHSGRIRVPIGVAYGSDTLLIKQLLLDVANEHPDVIKDSNIIPKPIVLFREFGDSSLNFELRCYIYNIEHRQITISDFNFAIDSSFREHGIEIPFPQRDVYIRETGTKINKSDQENN